MIKVPSPEWRIDAATSGFKRMSCFSAGRPFWIRPRNCPQISLLPKPSNFFMTPAELAVGTAVTALYLLLLGTAGYLCGMLVQYSKVFVVILPSLFFGLLILVGRDAGIREMLLPPINFVVQESSLILLALKIILIAAVMFGIALLLSNRAEVRK